MKSTTLGKVALATAIAGFGATTALAETFTLRIGSGHPNGPAVYVADTANFFVPEVKRRVAEETEHEIEFVEGYGGAIAGVAETLESVQNGILDIGSYCICFEPAKLFLHNFPYYAPFGPQDSDQAMDAVRATYDAVPWLTEQFTSEYGQVLLGLHGWDNYHLGTTDPWGHGRRSERRESWRRRSEPALAGICWRGAGPIDPARRLSQPADRRLQRLVDVPVGLPRFQIL